MRIGLNQNLVITQKLLNYSQRLLSLAKNLQKKLRKTRDFIAKFISLLLINLTHIILSMLLNSIPLKLSLDLWLSSNLRLSSNALSVDIKVSDTQNDLWGSF